MKLKLKLEWVSVTTWPRHFLLSAFCFLLFLPCAHAAVEVLGVQYQQDHPYSEYNCWFHTKNYPTSCGISITGCNAHVFLKNTGASAVTINDVNFAGYNLNTILKTVDFNGHFLSSIYLYWDDPPADVLNAGEPVWYRADPNPIPAGGTARVVVRLRSVPVTQPISIGVATSAGTVSTNVPVDASTPVLASVGFSTNRTKVYLHWRRNGGAAPASVWLNGTNVNSLTTTVGDPAMNFAVSVIQLPTALPNMSYHVFQGRYADGKTATGSLRVWVNRFLYGTWGVRETPDNDTAAAQAWINECQQRGVNCYVNNSSGGLNDFMATQAGRDYAEAHDYGYVKDSNAWGTNPRMWFVDDEPDFEEGNTEANFCGTGLRIPCGGGHTTGTLGRYLLAHGESLRAQNPLAPTTINLDGGFKPDGWYSYGQFADVMMVDSYYEGDQAYVNWSRPNAIPLFRKSTSVYAAAIATTTGAEPNPMHIILNSCENKDTATGNIWPFAQPANKRIQVYYALAGGAKGMAYWWFKKGYPYNGLGDGGPEATALWKEIGLCGNEIKTAQPLLVISHPVQSSTLNLQPSTNVWARALAADTDALILIVVNDNYLNDATGTYVTNVPNASVTATLPSWLANPNLSAFEISAGGLKDVTRVLNGNQLQVLLGTLTVTRMIVLTPNPQWRTLIQQRYDQMVRANVCAFAPELCVNTPPGIAQQPSNQTVVPGGTANFAVAVTGTSPMGYRWQKSWPDGQPFSNLNDGGHYSGVFTSTLTISNADGNDVANYRCTVTNAYGSTNSLSASLTVTNAPTLPPTITQQPTNQTVNAGGTANFTVAATGTGTLYYQWQKNNSNLSNGGHYSGSTTPTLTISNADISDVANYRCVVTNLYGSTNSASASLTVDLNFCTPGRLFGHGNMEDAGGYSVCPDWTSYSAGQGTAQWAKETTIVHGGAASQKCQNGNGGPGSLLGVRQTIDANIGDAFTFEGWVRPVSHPIHGQQVAMVAAWNGSTASPTTNASTSWNVSTGLRDIWTQLQNLSGNATATNVTLFLDSRRTSSSQDLTAYWDDVICYRAHVPPAPLVSSASGTALKVDLLPGCNTNGANQFAISIGGGAYTLGTHYVQANGTVSTTPVWQTDAAWANKTVTGLASGTPYTFKTQARYSSTLTQPTSLGAGTTLAPATTQPPQITQQPTPQNICPGDSAMFSVTATGSGLTYQWQTNGVNLSDNGHYSGVTAPTLTVFDAGGSDVANYRCVVTGSGSTNSAAAGLTLKAATIITADPDDQVVAPGANVVFTVSASGDGALTYQWRTNGVNLSNNAHHTGATSATLTVLNVTSADSADYRCVVTGGCGNTSSSPATLVVVTPGSCLGPLNADFEEGFVLAGGGYLAVHWTEWETDPNVVIGYDETTITHGGGHAQRIRVWGGPSGSSGGAYQRVPVTVGQSFSVGVWTYAGDNLTTCSLGVHPSGGTNAASGVSWSAGSTSTSWVQQTVAGVATADYITVYLKVTSTDDVKRNGYFDDVTPGNSSDSPRLAVLYSGNELTLAWPECPNAHLERTDSLFPPMNWSTVTNQPTINGGQKSLTIAPVGDAGYYRLVKD